MSSGTAKVQLNQSAEHEPYNNVKKKRKKNKNKEISLEFLASTLLV